jgi:hypothetical protein
MAFWHIEFPMSFYSLFYIAIFHHCLHLVLISLKVLLKSCLRRQIHSLFCDASQMTLTYLRTESKVDQSILLLIQRNRTGKHPSCIIVILSMNITESLICIACLIDNLFEKRNQYQSSSLEFKSILLSVTSHVGIMNNNFYFCVNSLHSGELEKDTTVLHIFFI